MTDAPKLDKMAEIARAMITRQLILASDTPEHALNDPWVLGYCFGMFDAMAQRNELDQYTEGFALITLSFIELMRARTDDLQAWREGAEWVRRALDSQTDARFTDGNQAGGTDLFAWFADTNKSPLSLFDYLNQTHRTT